MDIVTGIASALIALAALGFSIYSFKSQQARAEQHAVANVRPLLSMQSLNYVDHKAIKLMNYGLGPAIVKRAVFSKGGKSTDRIVDLFQLDIARWERFQNLPTDRAVPAQAEIVLVEQTLAHLVNQGYSENHACTLLSQWRAQKSGIEVYVEYQDIFGNNMEPLEDKLN